MTIEERWLPVPGWEGAYSLSSLARVRTDQHKIVRSDNVVIVIREKPRKVITWPNGRKTVRLRRDGKQFTVRIDWLMAELFGAPANINPPPANSSKLDRPCNHPQQTPANSNGWSP